MFEREKLSGNNFNDWFRQLKLVLRVEKKMFVIEQPLPAAPAADSAANVLLEWNAVYDAYNEVACLILGKEGKPVAAYVIQMKGYVDQLERLGYVLPQDLIVGLILNGLTKDFSGFVRNYNMHNMGKTVGELHAMLIEYEKGLPKKAETPQVMMIKGGKIQKANKKSLKVKGKGKANGKGKDKQVYIPKPKNPKPSAKEHPAKDDACHHCKEGFREARKLKQGALYLYIGNGVRAQLEAIGSFDLVLPNVLVIYEDTSPSEITSEIPMEVEGFEPPQEEDIPIRRSERTHRALNRLSLNVEAEEHSLGDLNEPTRYKATMLDSESNKWIDAMNAEIQSMMDNMKKTDMDGIVHTYKARLIAKGYTQLYGVDYKETLSPIVDIRAIRILISIAAYYDYEIWKMDIKIAFLNGYLDKDIYMVATLRNPEAELRVDCYCNAGFETDRDDTKSQTGYVFILNGCAVDWKSSKQSTTAMSATKAEYIADSEVAMETIWIRKFISGLGIVTTIKLNLLEMF
ncbi:retrotransposon protein, putative, ty1-copia subclass [Tanacetum coccineum]